ncbi:hypothetical protein GOQ04_14915 [Emticicia sp. ODNR4P]|nr:hypothetical protein [Emticicia sp. ODNR4P]
MNTIENKRAFFQSYLGTKNVLHCRSIAGLREVIELDNVELENSQLFLKPLKKLTAEEMLELNELLNFVLPLQKLDYQAWFFLLGIWVPSMMVILYANLGRYGDDEKTLMVMDSLREKGYAIGFNNIPVAKMVEYGWIVLND